MQEGGRVDYYFTLQQVNNQPINESKMTLLKACDAHYIQHENKCVDIAKDRVSIYSELPSSNQILKSCYMIDSLLTKYQKINFTDRRNWFCNSNKNPYKDKAFEVT
ncbi:unnamed protein product [Rotaria socialis]|uniref:Uncharacterized protein n=1 Tax=Rotaria socialis TaxID=392032 RepID=A0A820M277_9BILA|nr:unnamed protein product [Rotaria socialis]CAF3454110.1 unnamed protein product [Rotaria socialis]CAF3462461.1 unnamed protein product [Rotaria socialis]CAF4366959.1 unnamed protein product [Rotaria socialis]CAF4483491.1 unnamed protein product [Rotaria socialis]